MTTTLSKDELQSECEQIIKNITNDFTCAVKQAAEHNTIVVKYRDSFDQLLDVAYSRTSNGEILPIRRQCFTQYGALLCFCGNKYYEERVFVEHVMTCVFKYGEDKFKILRELGMVPNEVQSLLAKARERRKVTIGCVLLYQNGVGPKPYVEVALTNPLADYFLEGAVVWQATRFKPRPKVDVLTTDVLVHGTGKRVSLHFQLRPMFQVYENKFRRHVNKVESRNKKDLENNQACALVVEDIITSDDPQAQILVDVAGVDQVWLKRQRAAHAAADRDVVRERRIPNTDLWVRLISKKGTGRASPLPTGDLDSVFKEKRRKEAKRQTERENRKGENLGITKKAAKDDLKQHNKTLPNQTNSFNAQLKVEPIETASDIIELPTEIAVATEENGNTETENIDDSSTSTTVKEQQTRTNKPKKAILKYAKKRLSTDLEKSMILPKSRVRRRKAVYYKLS